MTPELTDLYISETRAALRVITERLNKLEYRLRCEDEIPAAEKEFERLLKIAKEFQIEYDQYPNDPKVTARLERAVEDLEQIAKKTEELYRSNEN